MEKKPKEIWDILKQQYEVTKRTNIYMDSIFKLKFNDRTTTFNEHIKEFSTRLNRLTKAVCSKTDPKTRAGATKVYVDYEKIKADRLLATLLEYYRMIANNIATQSKKLTYRHVASQLRELITNMKQQKAQNYKTPTATTFAVQQKIFNYCKIVKR